MVTILASSEDFLLTVHSKWVLLTGGTFVKMKVNDDFLKTNV